MTPPPPAAPSAGGLPVVWGLAHEAGRGDGPGVPRASKTSDVVAAALVRHVVDAGLPVGERLPDEAGMVARYGVGRESVREALRILEVQGVVTLRRGPGGGPVVEAVDPVHLARTTALHLHLAGATYGEVLDAWALLEPAVAARAAAAVQPADAVAAVVRAAESPCLARGGDGFHAALARATGSRVLELLQRAVGALVADQRGAALRPRDAARAEHREIAAAVVEGRPVAARRAAERHLAHLRTALLAGDGDVSSAPVAWS